MTDNVGPLLESLLEELVADEQLLELLGGAHVYRRYSVGTIQQIPGVYWHVVSEVPMENFWTAIVDFDAWAINDGTTGSYSVARQIGGRLTSILHRDLPREISGIVCWCQLEQSGDLGDPGETTSRRLYRFRIQPVRE